MGKWEWNTNRYNSSGFRPLKYRFCCNDSFKFFWTFSYFRLIQPTNSKIQKGLKKTQKSIFFHIVFSPNHPTIHMSKFLSFFCVDNLIIQFLQFHTMGKGSLHKKSGGGKNISVVFALTEGVGALAEALKVFKASVF